MSFYGHVTVSSILQNRNSGNQTAYVYGNVTNNGTIKNNNYSCYLYITGDINQNGSWINNHTYFSGDDDQNLSFTTSFNGANLTNSNNNGKVISNSTLVFNNTVVDFNYDTLMFANAADSLIVNGAYFQEGVITKEGSKTTGFLNCTQTANAYFHDVIIVAENIDLGGTFQFLSPMSFYGHVIVSGMLRNRNSGNYAAYVYGNVTNNGTIQNYTYNCYLYITGDINQNGTWINNHTYLSGDDDQNLSFTTGFNGANLTNSNNNGKVISNSTLVFNNTVIDFNYDTLMFAQAADSLVVNGSYFQEGVITKAGAKTAGFLNCTQTNNAYFHDMIIVGDNIDLGGTFQFLSPIAFYGHVTVSGILQNRNSGNYAAYVYGNVTNNGTIQNHSYTNSLYITGDISQNGVWSNNYNYLTGTTTQNISQTTAFTCNRILDTDPASPVQGNTDLIFQNTDVDMGGASLLMKDYSILSIKDAWFTNADIVSNAFDLSMTGGSYLENVSLDNVTIYDWVRVRNGCVFSGITTVEGTLSNYNSGNYTLTIDGDILNNGTIQNYSSSLYLNVDGDIYNNGNWQNAWTQLNGYGGSVNQTIDLQNGNTITGQIKLFSQTATTYDWYWNGSQLNPHPDFSGETSQVLNFLDPCSASFAGTYNCLTDLGWSRNIYITTNAITTPEVELTVLLEGPYNGTTMNADINTSGSLPLPQPYNTTPWNYWGSETVGTIPNGNVIDWVYVDFRDAVDAPSATEATRIDRQAAFLLNDGSVVSLDGISNLFFTGTIVNNLFVVIHHRNHLDIMSAFALSESAGVYAYDFTTSSGRAYGSNQNDLGGSVFGMIGGDANVDGTIDDFDGIDTWIPQAGQTGYLLGDGNLDAQVNNQDKNEVWLPNFGKSAMLPL